MSAYEQEKQQKTKCYTYFSLSGKFEPKEITALIGLEPYHEKKGESESEWRYGYNDRYEPIIADMFARTIKDLIPKVSIISDIVSVFHAKAYLVAVVEIYTDEVTPALAPSLEVMKFCVDSRTEVDIDLYNY